jgi:hypothetical protein
MSVIDELWWRAEISKDDLRWIQRNLGHGLEGQTRFKTIPKGVGIAMGLYRGIPWSERIVFVEGEDAPRALVPLGQKYDYRQAYFESRKAGDPYLSPHGLFRRLEPGYHRHAFEFMQKFGALFIHSTTRFRGESLLVSLSDFWNRHARFVAVAKLWEDRFDPGKLVTDWADMGERHEQLDRSAAAPLGYIPDTTYKYLRLCPKLPWELQPDEQEMLHSPNVLRQLVYELVHCELILNTQDCVHTWSRKTVPHDEFVWDDVFEPTRAFTSLWSVIWELFGLDTRQYAWRVCQICGRLFYPKDRRSVCCTTEHQSLWSKRQWAQQHRTSERQRHYMEESRTKHRSKRQGASAMRERTHPNSVKRDEHKEHAVRKGKGRKKAT